ncbi:MAG: LppX_LprAFG lipoprotein [Chloroflexota bacterium]|nr:LppX_LprAFG lipoprotein [Chloroflexota bacterium]MDQ5866773.1 LppX_LprAFG lipoprotein [Chloroflexota bacterium]
MFLSLHKLNKYLAPLAVGVLVVSAAGCGDPEKPNLTPDQVIEKAIPALQNANSFHFNLETSKLDKPQPGLFVTRADGDVVRPDKMVGEVSALAFGMPVEIKIVVDGDQQYMTDPASGQWSATSSMLNVAEYFNPDGVGDILGGVKDLQADPNETVDGSDSYRLKGSVPAEALKKLAPVVDATGDLQTVLWIGSGDFLLRRVQLTGPFFQGEPEDIVRTINMTDYNKQVVVETPVVR